jgi:nucleoside-diphosphate-sugar epimerase
VAVPADNPLAGDLDEVLGVAAPAFETLRGARLFITGGTGFVGTWLLESFAWANARMELGAEATVLSRNPDAFAEKVPHLAADPAIRFVRGDVTELSADVDGAPFTHVIHAATEASATVNERDPLAAVDTAVGGTRAVLECARTWGAARVLFTSSGAIYGPQPADLERIPEGLLGGPDALAPAAAYAEGKRMAEMLCAIYAKQFALPVTVARLFAFVGPYLPLDFHYAIGNFIADGLAGRPVAVVGDGQPIRSYLYAGDMAAWLWTILAFGEVGSAYNVGSEAAHSIASVAEVVAGAFDPPAEVRIEATATRAGSGNRYVPSTERARNELGLSETVSLVEAVRRTVQSYESRRR